MSISEKVECSGIKSVWRPLGRWECGDKLRERNLGVGDGKELTRVYIRSRIDPFSPAIHPFLLFPLFPVYLPFPSCLLSLFSFCLLRAFCPFSLSLSFVLSVPSLCLLLPCDLRSFRRNRLSPLAPLQTLVYVVCVRRDSAVVRASMHEVLNHWPGRRSCATYSSGSRKRLAGYKYVQKPRVQSILKNFINQFDYYESFMLVTEFIKYFCHK